MNKFDEFRSEVAQLLHKDGITNFKIDVVDPSDKLHQCQIKIHDNVSDKDFELIVVRDKDIGQMMPQLIKKLKELRSIV